MPLVIYRRPGSKIWHYRGTVGQPGKRKRIRGSTHTENKVDAARAASDLEQQFWEGNQAGPGAFLKFETACSTFIAAGKPFMVGRVDVVQAAREHFFGTIVNEIKSNAVREFANKVYGHCTGASKNRLAISPVQSIINFCAEQEMCNYIRVKRFPEHHKEKEPATLEWVQSFMAAAKPHLGAYALFMFLTGARPSEALAIDRDRDLDLQRATVTIRMKKVEKDKLVSVVRTAHLPSMLVAVLANLPAVSNRPLFVYRTYGDMRETWEHAAGKIAGPLLTPHCCRHGFATELLRRGVDVHTVAWLGGWASAKQVLETYGHAIKRRDLTNLIADTQLTQAVDEVAATNRKLIAF